MKIKHHLFITTYIFIISTTRLIAQSYCPEANLSLVLNAYTSYNSCVDFNNDGRVNALDLGVYLSGTYPAPTLVAGSGFTSASPQPPLQGSPSDPGYDAKAIARWNFVPAQRLSNAFNIGVVAFHRSGINRVEFILDAGPAVAITQSRLNPETNTQEYFVRIDPQQLTTSIHEVRAIVYPNHGEARVLAGPLSETTNPNTKKGEYSAFFVADPNNSLPRVEKYVSPTGSDSKGNGSLENPFQSIMKAVKAINTESGGKADGGIVNLLPGEHNYGTYAYANLSKTVDSYLTIRPAPGVNSEDAPIVSASSGGIRIEHVRFKNVTFRPLVANNTNTIILTSTGPTRMLWLDGCTLLGVGRTNPGDWTNSFTHVFTTDTFVTQSKNGVNGALVRNAALDVIGSDAFSGSGLVINSTVRKIDKSGTDFHPDFFQLYSPVGTTRENHIVMNSQMLEPSLTQGLFSGTSIKDVAFKNVIVRSDNSAGFMYIFQYGGLTKHMIIQNSQILGPAIWRVDGSFDGDDIVIKSTHFQGGLPACNIPDRCDITVIE